MHNKPDTLEDENTPYSNVCLPYPGLSIITGMLTHDEEL